MNCIGFDGKSGPTVHPCGVCENCKAIAAGRHIDILELDAASRTGVDDIRELLDGVRYKPTNARYKVYIIDEVHMLSKGAFNALLKTLEEPPSHVKFIFATTEIRKVPVTILSRCQRFDLQRISIETLVKLFKKIVAAEGIDADDEALEIVARAADGSARDGLSMLDQAIVLGDGKIKTDTVIEMIGLADRNQTIELFEKLIAGDMQAVLHNLSLQYKNGANSLAVLQDLIDITHMVARVKIVPGTLNSEMLSENEKKLCEKISSTISIAVLSRLWQMLIKGIYEVNNAPIPQDALEMVLIRAAYSANLPTPAELLEEVKKKSDLSVVKPALSPVSFNSKVVNIEQNKPEIAVEPETKTDTLLTSITENFTLQDFIIYLEEHKKMLLLYALKNDISIEQFAQGYIKMAISPKISPDFMQNFNKELEAATGSKWQIDIRRGPLGETIADKEKALIEQDKRSISEYPLVKAILSEFEGARIETVIRNISENDKETENEDFVVNTYEEE